MIHKCIKCGTPLVVGENITQNRLKRYKYVCQSCKRKHYIDHNEHIRKLHREREYRSGRQRPMSENRKCSSFLGVHVAERVLSHIFKNVQKMPYGNPGFDFRCSRDYLVDVKASCRRHHKTGADNWIFQVKKNQTADYFLCLAFDNRDSLNPEHIWLIPAAEINDRIGIGISETRTDKWDKYALDIDRVSVCCNILRG